mmetsp:Transcript_6902/g.13544  ORF Transcript_6902/g.13544 Transcript_6902/m.13544 type:complete len:225 (+) Transcript_6902:25-699(+)
MARSDSLATSPPVLAALRPNPQPFQPSDLAKQNRVHSALPPINVRSSLEAPALQHASPRLLLLRSLLGCLRVLVGPVQHRRQRPLHHLEIPRLRHHRRHLLRRALGRNRRLRLHRVVPCLERRNRVAAITLLRGGGRGLGCFVRLPQRFGGRLQRLGGGMDGVASLRLFGLVHSFLSHKLPFLCLDTRLFPRHLRVVAGNGVLHVLRKRGNHVVRYEGHRLFPL